MPRKELETFTLLMNDYEQMTLPLLVTESYASRYRTCLHAVWRKHYTTGKEGCKSSLTNKGTVKKTKMPREQHLNLKHTDYGPGACVHPNSIVPVTKLVLAAARLAFQLSLAAATTIFH